MKQELPLAPKRSKYQNYMMLNSENKENLEQFCGQNVKSPTFQENTIDNEKNNTGTLSQITQGAQSAKSNYMSERTMNLKKEITSLDEEIFLLQNSLKQALL